MSVENPLSGKAEPMRVERRPVKPAGEQQSKAGVTSDGVFVDGMAGNGAGITRETCPDEAQASTHAASLTTDKGEAVGAGVGAVDSSVDLWGKTTPREPSDSTYIQATRRSEGGGDGRAKARIKTPLPPPRKLQIALYRKAKAEPRWRFYSLYGEICRAEVLQLALEEVKANRGAAGVDGLRPEAIQKLEGGESEWIKALAEQLRAKRYRPDPVRRKHIPKGNGIT